MERETRIRQQENSVGSQQQSQSEFAGMRRNPLHPSGSGGNNTTNNELSSNTVDPFLSAASAAVVPTASSTNTVHSCNNGSSNSTVSTSVAPPSSLATDFHARQESADSGLGMGGSYSLPHTPEDFLASMDDTMDTTLDCNSFLFEPIYLCYFQNLLFIPNTMSTLLFYYHFRSCLSRYR